MTITTEEAERLATAYGGFWGLTDVAAALRSLAAERDAAMQWRAAIDDAHTKRLMPIEGSPAGALQRLIEVEVNAKREALQARVAELEGALDAAGRILHKAGEQFSEYAKQHAAKGTAVSDLKAAANKHWAERCFSAYWRAVEGGKDE